MKDCEPLIFQEGDISVKIAAAQESGDTNVMNVHPLIGIQAEIYLGEKGGRYDEVN